MPEFTVTTGTALDEILGGDHPVVFVPITVGAAAALSQGRVIARKTSDGKFYAWDPGGTGGLENAVGMLGIDAAAASADVVAIMAVHGIFRKTKLGWGSANDTQITAEIVKLQARAFYVK